MIVTKAGPRTEVKFDSISNGVCACSIISGCLDLASGKLLKSVEKDITHCVLLRMKDERESASLPAGMMQAATSSTTKSIFKRGTKRRIDLCCRGACDFVLLYERTSSITSPMISILSLN